MNLPEFTLSQLVAVLADAGVQAHATGEGTVQGMTIDSRKAEPGCLFVCKGAAFKPQYLGGALDAGAAAYLCDAAAEATLAQAYPQAPHIVTDDVRRAMALLAAVVFDRPDLKIDVVGITGTKGKSTTAYMMRSILIAAGQEPSILGSIDTDDGVEHFESHNTTPEAPDLWRHLANTVEAGHSRMVMEVSSHGLKYDRTLGVRFAIGCFLNIGRDHISPVEHPTFEDYFESKLKLFAQSRTALVNLNSDMADQVLEAAKASEQLVTFGVGRDDAGWNATDVAVEPQGIAFTVGTPTGERERIVLGMAGLFNVENALAAVVMSRMLGVTWNDIRTGLAHVRVPGRMEVVRSADGSVVALVDYAHNELSFKTFFSSVKEEYPGRKVIAVFGAPGNKAQERRVTLPQVAAEFADHMIFTEEDPAYERAEDICAEMMAATPAGASAEVICDREAACKRAFDMAFEAENGAVVALLAKGDETRQHRGDEFPEVKSDLAIAREILGSTEEVDA